MGRKNRHLSHLEVIDIVGEGKCIAKQDDMVIFLDGVVPGDIVDARVTKKKKSYLEAKPTNFIQRSPSRKEAFCDHFGLCGGCKWQELAYEQQLTFKQKVVNDAFERLGKLPTDTMMPILGSANTTFYRNKMEYTFTDNRWLTKAEIEEENSDHNRNGVGFHIPGFFDKVVDIHKCHLQGGLSNDIRNALRSFAHKQGLTFYNVKKHEGLLRNLIIRTASTGQTMVIVQFGENTETEIQQVMEFLNEQFPEITSLNYIINTKQNDSYADQEVVRFKGEAFIEEEMEGLKFQVSPKSFYQTNSDQAYELYKVARDFAKLSGEETVYDLYTGTGTIALFVAKQAAKVIGIEYVEDAIENAKKNAAANQVEHTDFFAGDMKDVLNAEFIAQHGAPDVIITDPPRAGMHPDVVETIRKANPKRIVYVSCNPATQARDIAMLHDLYEIEAIRPVDMFPHTHHVENVASLVRREG